MRCKLFLYFQLDKDTQSPPDAINFIFDLFCFLLLPYTSYRFTQLSYTVYKIPPMNNIHCILFCSFITFLYLCDFHFFLIPSSNSMLCQYKLLCHLRPSNTEKINILVRIKVLYYFLLVCSDCATSGTRFTSPIPSKFASPLIPVVFLFGVLLCSRLRVA